MVDLVAEIEALLARGPVGRREAEMRIAAAKLPLDERMWLLRAVARASRGLAVVPVKAAVGALDGAATAARPAAAPLRASHP
jgi:hypothetical protein